MTALLGIFLALVIAVVIVAPFIRRGDRRRSSSAFSVSQSSQDDSLERTYREIRTLGSELDSGNLTSSEFEDQLKDLRLSAAHALRERERRRMHSIEAELEIEQEVRRVRRQVHRDGEDAR